MKKIAITIIVILAMLFAMTGCTSDPDYSHAADDRIVSVDDCTLDVNNTVYIYYDTETGTMYQFIDGYHTGVSVPMYKADGTMATYDKNTNVDNRMKLIDTYSINVNNTVFVYYDVVEGTMYQYVDGYKSCGATVMYNADGTIATYNAE